MPLKTIFLVTVMLADALLQYFCHGAYAIADKEEEEDRQRRFYATQRAIAIAELQSATANSKKDGSAAPVPGSIPGVGKEVVPAVSAGPNAKAEMIVSGSAGTQVVAVKPDGTSAGAFSVPNSFANMSVSADGARVAGTSGNTFMLYNAATGQTLVNANLVASPAPNPSGTVIAPDGSGAYITDRNANYVFWVNFQDQAVKQFSNSAATAGQGKPAITPNGLQLWIPNLGANSVSVFDTLTNTPIITIPGLSSASEIGFTSDGTRAAVLSKPASGAGSIFGVDTSTFTSFGSAQVGNAPMSLSLDPYTKTFWTANSGSGTISAVDLSGTRPALTQTNQVGTSPSGIAAMNTYVP